MALINTSRKGESPFFPLNIGRDINEFPSVSYDVIYYYLE